MEGDPRYAAAPTPPNADPTRYSSRSISFVPPSPHDTHEAESGNAHEISEEAQLKRDEENQNLLPTINIARIMRNAIPVSGIIVSEEAVEAVQECVSEYISFVTSEANGHCLFERRRVVASEDILYALTKLGFHHYAAPLHLFLHRYRQYESDRKASLYGHSFLRRRPRQTPMPPPPIAPVYFNPAVVAPPRVVPPPPGRYFNPAAPTMNNYGYSRAAGSSFAPPLPNSHYAAPPRGINYGPSSIASANSFGGGVATPFFTAPPASAPPFIGANYHTPPPPAGSGINATPFLTTPAAGGPSFNGGNYHAPYLIAQPAGSSGGFSFEPHYS